MAAKTIPSLGEAFLGDDPSVMKALKITFGDSDQDVGINDADSTAAPVHSLCSLPVGISVYDVGWIVRKAFRAGVNINLGLDGDCDAFAEDTDINSTTVNLQLRTMKGWLIELNADSRSAGGSVAAPARIGGFTPDTANNLVAWAWSADSTNDTGILEVYVYYHGAAST